MIFVPLHSNDVPAVPAAAAILHRCRFLSAEYPLNIYFDIIKLGYDVELAYKKKAAD